LFVIDLPDASNEIMAAACAKEDEGHASSIAEEDEEDDLDEKSLNRKSKAMAEMEFKSMDVEFFNMEGTSIVKESWGPEKWATGYATRFWRMMLRELNERLPDTQREKFTVLYIQDRTTEVNNRPQSIDLYLLFLNQHSQAGREIWDRTGWVLQYELGQIHEIFYANFVNGRQFEAQAVRVWPSNVQPSLRGR
jgi:hypothetical protein